VVGEVSCVSDWVTIPCATNTMSPSAQSGTPSVCVDRICGMIFNSVTAASTTSSVPVNSKSMGENVMILLKLGSSGAFCSH